MKVITLRGTGFLSKTERYGGVLLAKICLEALATVGFLGGAHPNCYRFMLLPIAHSSRAGATLSLNAFHFYFRLAN